MRKLILATCCIILLSACAKQIESSRASYVGSWGSNEMVLSIHQNGMVDYARKKHGITTSIHAPLKEFEGDDFVVGYLFITTKFSVTEAPHKVNGKWQMVVDGIRLTKNAN